MELTLGDGVRTWARLDPEAVHGRGMVAPRLVFQFKARTSREKMEVQIHLMHGELLLGEERLGQGALTGAHLAPTEYQFELEVPVSRAALEYIDRALAGNAIDIALRLSGWLRARDFNNDGPGFASEPQPGEWVFENFGQARDMRLRFQVARSEWFSKVLEPIGTTEYLCTEVAIPRGDHPLRQAANHIRAAERALREGQDPQVFLACRAAIDALPGAPKAIFANLEYARERETLDALVLAAGNYLHLGRHAADEGPQQGDFPVDHGDAAFALNLAKLLLAHTARVLDRPSR
jgi:hypothetical protein